MNFIQKGLSLFRDLHIDIALIFSQFPPLNVALMFKPIQMVCNRSSGNLQTLRNSRRAERVFRKIFPQKKNQYSKLAYGYVLFIQFFIGDFNHIIGKPKQKLTNFCAGRKCCR